MKRTNQNILTIPIEFKVACTIYKVTEQEVLQIFIDHSSLFDSLCEVYSEGFSEATRTIAQYVRSRPIFREKLLFDGKKYRTTRLNEAAALIFYITKNLRENENGKDTPYAQLSREVVPTRIELISKV